MPLKNKFTTVIIVYWVLLTYILAALIWWYIALQKQNTQMANLLFNEISQTDPKRAQKMAKIEAARKRKISQYTGEGVTFLALIALGAVFVFRAANKQIKFNQQQQNFMMAVTHELKTPIAITKLNLETLEKRKLEEVQQKKLINNTLFEANRLNSLCNNILLAAQLDGAATLTHFELLALDQLIATVYNDYKSRYPTRKIQLTNNTTIKVFGDKLQLEMLTSNLIENAIKYSKSDSTVNVILQQKNNQTELMVIDEGEGIDDDNKKLIFEKFYRIGNENTRKTKGTGLGLYLCKKIAKAHKAKISISNNQPKGSIFTVTFT